LATNWTPDIRFPADVWLFSLAPCPDPAWVPTSLLSTVWCRG